MTLLQFLEKSAQVLKKLLELVVFLLFATMAVLVFAQVFTRFLTTSSLTWSEELSRFTLVWLIYMASILAYGEKIHIMVDALIVNLKGKVRLAVQLVNRLCVLVFALCIIVGALEFMPTTAMQESPANGIVMSHVYVAIPISMLFMGIITLKEICQIVAALRRPQSMEDAG